jgi:HEAT repeat protein
MTRSSDLVSAFRALTDRDAQVRQEAWKRLTEAGVSFEAVASYLHHGQPRVREGAARYLPRSVDLDRVRAVDILRERVHDANSYVAAAALETLGRLKADEARDDVLLSLDDSHPMVMRAALFALGMIGPTDMGARIVPFLEAASPHLRVAAIDALAELRYRPAIPQLIEMLRSHAGAIRERHFEFTEPCQLIRALGLLRAEEAIPLLIEFVRGEIGLRSRALKVLEHFDSPAATIALAAFLKELARQPASPELIIHIIRHLVDVDFRLAAPDVIPLLDCQHADIRRAALRALRHWRLAEAKSSVRDLAFRETSDLVRPEAVRTYGMLAGPCALPELEHFARDVNAWVRRAVAESILSWPDAPQPAQSLLEQMRGDPALATLFNVAPRPLLPEAADASLVPERLRPFVPSLRIALKTWSEGLDAGDPLHQALSQVLQALSDHSTKSDASAPSSCEGPL